MPKATVSSATVETKELKSAPPDGFVKLRRMSYREFLKRRDMASGMSFKGQSQREMEAKIVAANEIVTKFEFERCIVDHNLEDDDGKKLNFNAPQAFDMLDPRIGEEISQYIDEMNQFNKDESEDENLEPPSEA